MTGDNFGKTTQQNEPQMALVHRERLKRPRLSWTDARGSHELVLDAAEGAPAILGSASHANVVVADRAVSRIHAELEPVMDRAIGGGAGLWVRDLGSRNGTYVDGILVSGARVPDGGTITVGSVTIRIRYGELETAEEHVWGASRYGPLVGKSVVMRKLFARLDQLAQTDLAVLVTGETGTGKELVARAIHDASPRARHDLGILDCAAMPETLLEAELFGHRRGAFTGAETSREGIVERCDGGTLFLDEVGELPLALQPKLLRLLETKTYRRLGDTSFRQADVRFVAATHRDLRKMVNVGTFREDLYFRLAVGVVHVPPLRERTTAEGASDIELLVDHFVGGRWPPTVTRAALVARAAERAWMGNVRELRSFVMRAIALGTDDPDRDVPESSTLDAAPEGIADDPLPAPMSFEPLGGDAPPRLALDRPFKEIRDAWMDHLEREYIGELLRIHERNVSAVARASGLDRTYVHRLIRKHGL